MKVPKFSKNLADLLIPLNRRQVLGQNSAQYIVLCIRDFVSREKGRYIVECTTHEGAGGVSYIYVYVLELNYGFPLARADIKIESLAEGRVKINAKVGLSASSCVLLLLYISIASAFTLLIRWHFLFYPTLLFVLIAIVTMCLFIYRAVIYINKTIIECI